MMTFTANFTIEKNKKTDLAPVWILRLTVAAVDYWLSDNVFNIPGWQGGVTTRAWIKSWGQLQQGISGALDEFHVSDFSCGCLIDPDDADNLEHLATMHNIEESPAELYIWFHGLNPSTDPPVRMWRGYAKDSPLPDDLTCELHLEDETIRLNNYVGHKLDATTYPLADPDDIGKIIPISFGTVLQLRALCVDSGWVTSIIADLAASATSFTVSELPAYPVANRIVMIDDEQIYINSVAGKALTVTRGYGGTIATVHTKGSTVIEKKTSPLVYLVDDRPLDAIGTIMAMVRGVGVDITSDCTKYLGTPGNQLAAYPGKAAITIPDFARVSQRISIVLNGNVSASDPGHGHNAGNNVVTLSATQSGGGTSNTKSFRSFSWAAVYNLSRSPAVQEAVVMNVSFAAVGGTIISCSMTATVNVSLPTTGGYWYLMAGGKRITGAFTDCPANYSPVITHDATSMQGNELSLVVAAYATGENMALTAIAGGCINAASRSITYTNTSSVTIAPSGTGVQVASTLALSGNSVADIMIGDMILVDVTRNVTAPADVVQYLLTNYGPGYTLGTLGSMPGGYALNGSITEYRRLLEWCNVLAFQCRSRFRMHNGAAQLIVRPDTLVSDKTINHCVQNEGQRVLSRSKAPLEEVINKISILFNRDWTKSGDTAYQKVSSASNAASIAIYGERERPELFRFDFVTSATMAASVRDYYLAWYAVRRWIYTFDTYLDHIEMEFNDVLTLGFLANQVTIINEARLYPGQSDRMDKITFITEG